MLCLMLGVRSINQDTERDVADRGHHFSKEWQQIG